MSVPRLSVLPAAIRSVPAVRRSSVRSALMALAALAIAAGTVGAAAAPSPPGVHTATADAGLVDRATYPAKDDVNLLASRCTPDESPVPAGEYVFGVLTDGARLLSTDPAADRRIYVDQAGRITSSSETHAAHAIFCGDGTYFTTVPIGPFDDAPPDAPYQLVVASSESVDACIAAGDPSGFGCAEVRVMAVTFGIDPLETLPPSPTASPSESAAPTVSGSPDPSGSVDPSASPTASPSESPIGSDAGLDGSPAASATPGGSPSPTPPPATAAPPQTPRPNPGGGSSGGAPVGTPVRTPQPTPYVIPSGYLDCPGQIVTPTGCKPVDWQPSIPGQTPQPSWSWGAPPTGAPVFPGANAPTSTPATGGGTTGPSATPGPSALGPVQAGVDLGSSAGPSASVTPGPTFGAANGASATAGGTTVAGGAVAGITSGPGGVASPPAQPVPTASTAPGSRPALPMLLAVLMLALIGAAAAAIIGWARRGMGPRAGTEH